MTHKATLTTLGSIKKQASPATLASAIEQHLSKEVASFHTPGHKGQSGMLNGFCTSFDVTELPTLDELAYADGVLQTLQSRIAEFWGAKQSFISINGASAGLLAAIMACASRGSKILVPRHCHRSVVNALVLSGLEPIWYEGQFHTEWSLYGETNVETFSRAINEHSDIACALVVSPTYAGTVSDIRQLSGICHEKKVPLIVDEAHGAHLMPAAGVPLSAVALGADIVVHSFHKTVGALTQTGAVHVTEDSLVEPNAVRLSLNTIMSSSPSYLLMLSIEQALNQLSAERIHFITREAEQLRKRLHSLAFVTTYPHVGAGSWHILMSVPGLTANELWNKLVERGIYPEAQLGTGVLLLLGVGSSAEDSTALLEAMEEITCKATGTGFNGTKDTAEQSSLSNDKVPFRHFGEQVLSPRKAFFSAVETVTRQHALGRIAAECIAPCPPGIPLVVPGQRITQEVLSFCTQTTLRVVVESQNQGEQ